MTATTKDNLAYPPAPIDLLLDEQIDKIATDSAMTEIKTIDAQIPGASKMILTWAMQAVNSTLDGYMTNEVTKGGKAEGRSLSTDKNEVPSVAEPEEEFYMRPNGQKYFHRPWGESHTDVQVLQKARIANQFPLLYGPPGTGKTAMAEAAYGEELVTILGTGDTEVADLVGGYIQNIEGAYEWIDGPLLIAMEEGRPLLVDEIGIIDPKVLTVLYGAMDGRRELRVTADPSRGIVKAKDGFFVIGATNPNAPGVRLSEALLSRFTLHVEVLTDYALARKLRVNKDIVAMAQSLDHRVRNTGELEWAPQFRELLAFRDVESQFGRRFAIENLIASAPESMRPEVVNTLAKGPLGEKYFPAQIK